jgi:hypothetical protein
MIAMTGGRRKGYRHGNAGSTVDDRRQKVSEKQRRVRNYQQQSAIGAQESKSGCLLEGGACQKASLLPFRMLYTLPIRVNITSQFSICRID